MHSLYFRTGRVLLLSAAALLFAGVVLPSAAHAAGPTFTANETVSNVTLGTANQTAATSSTQANVPEVKANLILNVVTAPLTTNTITVGTCVVTFATTTAGVNSTQDLSCSGDSAARITTATTSNDVAKTPAQIATDLASITNATSTGHGAISFAIGTTTTKVSITTTGTETSATAITFTDGTSGKIVSAGSTSGTIPLAQVWTYTPANVEVGDTFRAIINGTTVSYVAAAGTVADVTAGLTAAINASAQASAVTAVDGTTLITVTSDTAGSAFTLTTATVNRPAVAQQVTFTPANVVKSSFVLTLDGSGYTYNTSSSATIQEVVEALSALAVGDAALTCSEDDTKITCVANVAGTPFTYGTGTTDLSGGNGGGGGSHHGGGSGSSSSSSSSTDASMQAQVASLQAQLAALMAHASGGTTVTMPTTGFVRDLDVGATGSDVMALQVWLNHHGFVIAASGAGSAGMETSTFGGLTRAALAKWQASVGITPAAGFFGPKTRAYLAAHS